MVAGEGVQEQARKLVADRLPEPESSRWLDVLQGVHASAVLEDERHRAVLRLCGIHVPEYRLGARPEDPSRE